MRDWRRYSKDELCNKLEEINWQSDEDSVQGFWNAFEYKLIGVVDAIVPMREFTNRVSVKIEVPQAIKNKVNIRKRLLKKFKATPTPELKLRIKGLNKDIKSHHWNEKSKSIRRSIIPGNSESLWKAVKIAKDVNTTNLPQTMFQNENQVETGY